MKLEILESTVAGDSIWIAGTVVNVDESTAAELIRDNKARPAAQVKAAAQPQEK